MNAHLAALLVSGLLASTGLISAHAGTVLRDMGQGCYLIDFEGVDGEGVGTVPGPPITTHFGSSWLGVVDQDDGGGGYFANEPSSSTAAMPLYNQVEIWVRGWGDVGSIRPQSVQFKYSAGGITVGSTVQADVLGGPVLEVPFVNGAASGGASCTGDPTGDLCQWHTITLATNGNLIQSLYFSGWMIRFAMDDMLLCVDPDQAVPCCLPSGECALLSPVACEYAEGMVRPGSECTETTCSATPVEPASWGRLKSVYRE